MWMLWIIVGLFMWSIEPFRWRGFAAALVVASCLTGLAIVMASASATPPDRPFDPATLSFNFLVKLIGACLVYGIVALLRGWWRRNGPTV